MLPFIALAERLISRGYQVTIFTNHNWRDLVVAIGADFFGVAPPDPSQSGRNDIEFFEGVTLPSFLVQFEAVADAVRLGRRPLLLFKDNMLGFACAAEKFQLPCGSVYLQPSAVFSRHRPSWPLTFVTEGRLGWLGRRLIVPFIYGVFDLRNPYRSHARRFRERVGAKPRRGSRRGSESDFSLILCPEWFALPQPDWPRNSFAIGFPFGDPQPLPPEIGEFMAEGVRPLVATPGTGVNDVRLFFDKAAAAAAAVGLPSIFLSPHARQDWYPASQVLVHPFADLGALLPRCTALIHHGGIGSVAQALRAGIPQLVVPDRFDQPDNAIRVATLGLGGAIMDRDASGNVWGSALAKLLRSSHVRMQLTTAARLIAMQDPQGAALSVVEKALRLHGRRPVCAALESR